MKPYAKFLLAKVNWRAVVVALKELARIAIFGAISAVLSYTTTKVASLDPTSAYAVIGTIVLRFADKYVHANENIPSSGLVPF